MFLLPTNVTARSTKYNFGSRSLDQRIFSSAAALYLIGFRVGNKTKNGATAPFFVYLNIIYFCTKKFTKNSTTSTGILIIASFAPMFVNIITSIDPVETTDSASI